MTINDGELYEAVDTNCELCNGTGIYDDPELGDIDCYCVGDSSMTGDRYEGCTPHDLSDDAEATIGMVAESSRTVKQTFVFVTSSKVVTTIAARSIPSFR